MLWGLISLWRIPRLWTCANILNSLDAISERNWVSVFDYSLIMWDRSLFRRSIYKKANFSVLPELYILGIPFTPSSIFKIVHSFFRKGIADPFNNSNLSAIYFWVSLFVTRNTEPNDPLAILLWTIYLEFRTESDCRYTEMVVLSI